MVVVVVVEMKGEMEVARVWLLVKRRMKWKRIRNEKEKYLYDLEFVKEVKIIKREGGFCKVEEGMSVLLLATWPAMGEREKEGY